MKLVSAKTLVSVKRHARLRGSLLLLPSPRAPGRRGGQISQTRGDGRLLVGTQFRTYYDVQMVERHGLDTGTLRRPVNFELPKKI
mmetsp:Transcript_64696/g.152096  ORF Transcript_64696/g.152096 Transcript_64696/m.152096 type:complete len:85 (+) Transcript_64696:373-627(+)